MLALNWAMQPDLGAQRILRPGKWLRLRSLCWMVVMIFAIVLAFGPGMEALSHSLPKQPVYQFLAEVSGALIVLGAYIRFPLSLRNVEDLLFERGYDLCHETVLLGPV